MELVNDLTAHGPWAVVAVVVLGVALIMKIIALAIRLAVVAALVVGAVLVLGGGSPSDSALSVPSTAVATAPGR